MNIITPNIADSEALSKFFQKEIENVWKQYNYPKEDIENWKDWHSTNELVEKIIDTNRFFSIMRDEKGEIIGAFESKKSSIEENTEIIQWTLIDEKNTWQWLWSMFRYDFLLYCRENGVKKIKTFCHKGNIASQNLSKKFGFEIIDSDEDILIFEKKFINFTKIK